MPVNFEEIDQLADWQAKAYLAGYKQATADHDFKKELDFIMFKVNECDRLRCYVSELASLLEHTTKDVECLLEEVARLKDMEKLWNTK